MEVELNFQVQKTQSRLLLRWSSADANVVTVTSSAQTQGNLVDAFAALHNTRKPE